MNTKNGPLRTNKIAILIHISKISLIIALFSVLIHLAINQIKIS